MTIKIIKRFFLRKSSFLSSVYGAVCAVNQYRVWGKKGKGQMQGAKVKVSVQCSSSSVSCSKQILVMGLFRNPVFVLIRT